MSDRPVPPEIVALGGLAAGGLVTMFATIPGILLLGGGEWREAADIAYYITIAALVGIGVLIVAGAFMDEVEEWDV